MNEMNENLFPETPVAEPELPLPGAILRATREAHGYSLSDVSQVLKFSVRQLDALENDDYSHLSGTTFIRGFVRSYARYLKLDETPLLLALEPKVPVAVTEVKSVESMDEEMPEQGADTSSRRAYLLAAGVLLLGVLAWFAIQGRAPEKRAEGQQIAAPAPATITESAPAATAPAPVPTATTPAPASNAAPVTVQQPAAASVSAPSAAVASAATPAAATAVPAAAPPVPVSADERQFVLRFSAESWVEVRDAAQHVLFSGRNPAGSSQTLHGKPPFQLVVGNASAVKLRYEDRDIDLQPYTRVDVARLTLDDNTK